MLRLQLWSYKPKLFLVNSRTIRLYPSLSDLQTFYRNKLVAWIYIRYAGQTYTSIDIGSTLIIWLSKHAHDAQKDLLHTLNRRPSFRTKFVMIWIVAGGMKDWDAHRPIFVDYSLLIFDYKENEPFGWKISQMNFIVGGLKG